MAVGDTWIRFNYDSRFFAYTDIDIVYNNMVYIREKLISKTYTVPALTVPDTSKGCATPPDKILSIMNIIELDIDNIQYAIDWDSGFYGESFRWEYDTKRKYEKVSRWYNYLTDLHTVISGGKKTKFLYDKDSNQIYDEDNEKILVYEGVI